MISSSKASGRRLALALFAASTLALAGGTFAGCAIDLGGHHQHAHRGHGHRHPHGHRGHHGHGHGRHGGHGHGRHGGHGHRGHR